MFYVRKLKISYYLLPSLLATTVICSNLSLKGNATFPAPSAWSDQDDLRRAPKFLKENCTCLSQWQCECCANVNNDLLSVHQKLCADWIIYSNSWDIQANVRLNKNVLYTNTFSAWNIPPFCVPIWPALALTACVQMHSISQHKLNTIHGCANLTINFIAFNLINFQMGCVDVGANGVHFVEANHQDTGTISTEKPPEIELETDNLIKVTTPSTRDVARSSTARQDSLVYLMSEDF